MTPTPNPTLTARIAELGSAVTDLYLDYNSLAVSYITRLAYDHHKGGPPLATLEPGHLRLMAQPVRRFLADGSWSGESGFDATCTLLLGALADEPQLGEAG